MRWLALALAALFLVVPSVAAESPSWQYQLQGTVNTAIDVYWFDIDGFDSTSEKVAAIHAKGSVAICYISAGSWENWRPDAGRFPASVKGRRNGWPGERWLDIRRLDVLGPIISARVDMCVSKGFDILEPDNVDGYSNRTGFPLTYQDQLIYNRWLADTAHAKGLQVALKNDIEQVQDLVGWFDLAINEECYRYRECGQLQPFVNAGKPVLHVEYRSSCPPARDGFHTILKNEDLGAYRVVC
jgi:hypothetical protein